MGLTEDGRQEQQQQHHHRYACNGTYKEESWGSFTGYEFEIPSPLMLKILFRQSSITATTLSGALYKDSIPGCHKVSSHIHGNTFKRVPGGYTERGEVEALLEGLDGSETPLLVYSLSKSGCMFTSRGTILTTCRLLTPLEIDSLLHSLMLSPC